MSNMKSNRLGRVLVDALGAGLHWRLWVLWIIATLACALVAAIPICGWLAEQFNHSVHAADIAAGKAPMLMLDATMARHAPLAVLMESTWVATFLMLLLSPLLAGAAVAGLRNRNAGFAELLQGGVAHYGPMLRLLLWSAVPLGLALLVLSILLGMNEAAHEDAVIAADASTGRKIALAIGGLVLVLAHASIEAGRGWLAADGRLRSALRAWWRGLRLLAKRPIAVLAVYLLTTLLALAFAAAMLALRQRIGVSGTGGFLLALLAGGLVPAALAWGRIARLSGMQALAQDAHARR